MEANDCNNHIHNDFVYDYILLLNMRVSYSFTYDLLTSSSLLNPLSEFKIIKINISKANINQIDHSTLGLFKCLI